MAKNFNINSRTVVGPIAAFTMAGLLFVYSRSSIKAAKRNAERHRSADGGQISWRNENLRRHGMLKRPEDDASLGQLVREANDEVDGGVGKAQARLDAEEIFRAKRRKPGANSEAAKMEEQIKRLALKAWEKFQAMPSSRRLLIAVSGIPGSGKTTLAKLVARRLNTIHGEDSPGCASTPIASFVPMDGYHLSRAQLSAMPDPVNAHARRGAAFTFDDKTFLALVKKLRDPILPESTTLYAPSFDHAIKDPVENDITIPPTTRVVIFEGNYLSLNKGLWKESAALMDELWFMQVDFETARQRLVKRHVEAGIARDEIDANKRVTENDLVNGKEIVDDRLDVQEVVISKEDDSWTEGA